MGFLKDNSTSERVVIYASAPHVLIHGVLAPLRNLNPPDQADLSHDFPTTDRGWMIQHAYGGGKGHRVWLEEPLADAGKTFKGGEKLVFWRSWAGRDRDPNEISQKFAHSLEIHMVPERNAYCRLDELGDPIDVVSIYQEPGDDDRFGAAVVSITANDLWEYARLTRSGIVYFFDFTRYERGFPGWSNLNRSKITDKDLFYDRAIDDGIGSFCRGRFIARPKISKREIVRRRKHSLDPKRQYATFKAIDFRTGDKIEASSDPNKMASYFDKGSILPPQMSPVFFKSEVLHRYKVNPAKYVLTDRDISCKGAWHLKTYDVNSAGQVHTYLGYLGDLPYQEQLYWASMNEWPKAPISERAFQTDFKGEVATDYDSLVAVKRKVKRLDELAPIWWNPRGKAAADSVQYPAGDSDVDWAMELLRLDQLVVEGFLLKPLKEIVTGMGRHFEPEWQSLVALRECLFGNLLVDRSIHTFFLSVRCLDVFGETQPAQPARCANQHHVRPWRQSLEDHQCLRVCPESSCWIA